MEIVTIVKQCILISTSRLLISPVLFDYILLRVQYITRYQLLVIPSHRSKNGLGTVYEKHSFSFSFLPIKGGIVGNGEQ